MTPFDAFQLGGIAIAGRSGSGKSSVFFGSHYVPRVIIADTGSMGHRTFSHTPTEVVIVNPLNKQTSPVKQVMNEIERAETDGELYCLDSFSTLQEMEVMWLKNTMGRNAMTLPMFSTVVGALRDLAMLLAMGRGFTVFNTSPGGRIRQPDGTLQEIPQGCITGFPALSGLAQGSETILARFSTVYVAFPGYVKKHPETGETLSYIGRGFITPTDDFRPQDVSRYAPLKDPLSLLRAQDIDDEGTKRSTRVHPFGPAGTGWIDTLIDAMMPGKAEEAKESVEKKKKGKAEKAAF